MRTWIIFWVFSGAFVILPPRLPDTIGDSCFWKPFFKMKANKPYTSAQIAHTPSKSRGCAPNPAFLSPQEGAFQQGWKLVFALTARRRIQRVCLSLLFVQPGDLILPAFQNYVSMSASNLSSIGTQGKPESSSSSFECLVP